MVLRRHNCKAECCRVEDYAYSKRYKNLEGSGFSRFQELETKRSLAPLEASWNIANRIQTPRLARTKTANHKDLTTKNTSNQKFKLSLPASIATSASVKKMDRIISVITAAPIKK